MIESPARVVIVIDLVGVKERLSGNTANLFRSYKMKRSVEAIVELHCNEDFADIVHECDRADESSRSAAVHDSLFFDIVLDVLLRSEMGNGRFRVVAVGTSVDESVHNMLDTSLECSCVHGLALSLFDLGGILLADLECGARKLSPWSMGLAEDGLWVAEVASYGSGVWFAGE